MSRFSRNRALSGETPFAASFFFTVLAVSLSSVATRILPPPVAIGGIFAFPTAIAFVLIVRLGLAIWPAIFLGGALGVAGSLSPSGVLTMLIHGLALTLQVVPAATRLPLIPRFRLDRPRDAAINLLALLLLSLPAGVGLRSLAAPSLFVDGYLADAGGLLVFGLPLLFWRRSQGILPSGSQRLEAVVAGALLLLLTLSVFLLPAAPGAAHRMLPYLPACAALWLSLRFHSLIAAASMIFLASVAWAFTAMGAGPLAHSVDAVVMLRIYLATLSVAIFFLVLLRRRAARVEAMHRRSDFEFQLMAERSREIVFRLRRNPEPVFEFLSPSIRQLTGHSHRTFLANPLLTLDLCHPDDRPLMQYALHSDEPEMTTELRWKSRDGDYRWVELYQVALFDRKGQVVGIEGTGRDITERKNAERNILHLNRLLLALREIGQLLARVHEPDALLNGACGILVRNRGYRIAWISMNAGEGLIPIAAAGDALPSLPELLPITHAALTSAEREASVASTSHAIRTDASSPSSPHRGLLSVPLSIESRRYGWMNVCVDDARAVDPEEEDLLVEMGQDIAYGLLYLESRQAIAEASAALRNSEEQYRLLVEEAAEGIFVIDREGIFTEMNPFGCTMLGLDRSEIVGRPIQDFFPSSDGQGDLAGLDATMNLERKMLRPDGSTIEVEINTSLLPGGSVQGLMRDVSERKRAEREIERLAFFDPLTGLANRRLLREHLERDMSFMRRRDRFSGLLFLDLDHFKHINDSLGHGAGDQILQQVADRLRLELRAEDTIARLGGDEFVALLFDLADNAPEAAIQAQTVAEKLLETLAPPYQISLGQFFITPSIGITIFPRERQTIDDVLREADTAMYQAKTEGRNGFRFFQPEMQMAAETRVSMEIDLRRAIQAGEFLAHYQPQVDAAGMLCGMEALLRWQHPDRGMVLPGHFVSVAEETGLIVPLGEQLLEIACTQLREWSLRHTSPPTLSVNISARQFAQADFVPTVRTILRRTGAPPDRLVFEITESVFLDRVEDSVRRMHELRAMGIRFSVDDFGTGYSSLTYLKRLPLDEIKIDQSFVRDAAENDYSRSIIQTILSIAHQLDMSVVAEGVESQEQQDLLHRLGCHRFQGYLYGQPSPAHMHDRIISPGARFFV